MRYSHSVRCHSLVALIATLIHFASASSVQAGFGDHKILDQTGCSYRCPACNHCCELKAEAVEETKDCFNVESKVICIPRVVFPWQHKKLLGCKRCDGVGCNNCVHNGARARRVCVLTIDSYKCPACDYSWTPIQKPCATGGCDQGCNGGCDAVISTPAAGTAAPPVVVPPAPQASGNSASLQDSNRVLEPTSVGHTMSVNAVKPATIRSSTRRPIRLPIPADR